MHHTCLLALAGFIALVSIGCRGHSVAHQSGFYSYDRKAVVAFLEENHLSGNPVWIKRSATGEKVYVFLHDKLQSSEYRVVIVERGGITVRQAPGINAFFNEKEEVVAWSMDLKEGIMFRNGFLLNLPQFAYFDVDPGGEYFIIGETSNKTWVGRVDHPEVPTLVTTDFRGRRLFSTNQGLAVAGYAHRNGSDTARCIFIDRNETDDSFVITKSLDFPSFSGVVEVSPDGKALVLQGRSELFAAWHIYDISTGNTRRMRTSTQFGFFLSADLLAISQGNGHLKMRKGNGVEPRSRHN